MIRIVTDGAADMPQEWLEEYHIHRIPIDIQFGNQSYLQGVDITDETFYRLIDESGVVPQTSQPSPHRLAAFYEAIADPGDTIISIHVGEKLSGTMDSARAAARQVKDKFTVLPFDSAAGSAAIGWMCRHASILARRGASPSDILAALEKARPRVVILLTLDTLKYAHLSGRVSRLQSTLASMLRVKPIVELKNGLLEMVDKVRTRSASFQRLLDMAEGRIGSSPMNLSVVHARAPQDAANLFNQALRRFNLVGSHVIDLSISVAVHLGPGTVGLVFYPAEQGAV